MNNETINNLTLTAIEELKALPIKHKSRVVQKNLVLWEQELFPLLEDVGMPIYHFLLVKIFKPAGFDVPSEDDKEGFKKASDNLCTTVNRVRKSMIKKGLLVPSSGSVAMSLPAAHGVPGVVVQPVGSMVSVAQSNPSLGSVPSVESVQPVMAPIVPVVASGEMAWVYPKTSKVQPVEIDTWEDEQTRLQKEKFGEIEGWDVWNGRDEYLWLELLGEIERFNKIQPKQSYLWKHDNQFQFKQSIKKDKQLTDVYDLLMSKLKKPIRQI